MTSNYVITVYVIFLSWHVHGLQMVYLLIPGVTIAFTKILLVCSWLLGFASRTNTVLLPKVVTNKTKSNEPRRPPLVEQALCPDPHWRHDGEANYTPSSSN
jgi:hypothetical protein